MNVEKTKIRRISLQLPTVQIIVDQKEVENVDYFSYLGSLITNDARCTCEIKCRIAVAKAALNKKKALFTSNSDLNLRKKLEKYYIGSIALYDARTSTHQRVGETYLESFEVWYWRRM